MKIARAVRIRRFPIRLWLCRESFLQAFVVLQTFQAFFLAQYVDVALREHGAKAGGKFAAALEMVEQRHAADGGFPAIECGVQGVREFACIGIARRSPGDGRGSGVKILAIRREEMLPGGLASRSACGG